MLTTLLMILAVACSKNNNGTDPDVVHAIDPGNQPAWLVEMVKGYSNCECDPVFLKGTYNGQVIYVSRSGTPFCCGYDLVYDSKGNKLFPDYPAGNVDEYKKYLAEVTGLQEIWRCSKTTSTGK
jgi:hypothetical protein